jgi:WD40 repeat protein
LIYTNNTINTNREGPPHSASRAAEPLLEAFGVNVATSKPKATERSCFGHKETIFGVAFSECGMFCATASQDSTINVWDVDKNVLLTSLKEHSKAFECLRVAWASPQWAMDVLDRTSGEFCHLLASSGADGTVKLWGCADPMKKDEWKCHMTLDHATFLGRSKDNKQENKEEATEEAKNKDKPQVYALQFIDHWSAFTCGQCSETKNSFLVTSSDDYVHFWEIDAQPPEQSIQLEGNQIRLLPHTLKLMEVMSLHFGPLENYGYGVTACSITGSGLKLPSAPSTITEDNTAFGGDRNPGDVIFVFDAAYCAANGLFGAALSDGSLRLVNGRGVCISILNLPGCQSHLTSFCWDSTGTRLATSVATGHLITWHLDVGGVQGGHTVATCSSIMEGGK